MSITINGSGTITGISVGGLPDGVITTDDIAADAVTPDKITGGPAFHVTKNNSQSVTNNVWTKIQFDDETFDTNSAYDAVTNYRFQPVVAGYYQINLHLSSTSTDFLVGIFKNGSEYARGRNNYQAVSVSQLVYLNGSTDYIEPYGYVTSTASFSSISGTENQFSGCLVRPE